MSFLFGGSKPKRTSSDRAPETALRISSAVNGIPKPRGWGQMRVAGNLVWWSNLNATQVADSSSGGSVSGGKGGGGSATSQSTKTQYNVDFIQVINSGQVSSVLQCYLKGSPDTMANQGLNVQSGAQGQAPVSIVSSLPAASGGIGYSGQAFVWATQYNLGDTAELPNLNYEVLFSINDGISGLPDADPADIIPDYLTNSQNSIGFPSNLLGDFSKSGTYSQYCRAQGLVLSPYESSPRSIRDMLTELMMSTNSDTVWSSGKFSAVPYGDTPLSANGCNYTPPTPVYNLTDSDFLFGDAVASGSPNTTDPVVVTRTPTWKLNNHVQVEFFDRSINYNPNVVDYQDEAAVQTFGKRSRDKTALHMIANSGVATTIAALLLGREQIAAKYQFTLGPWAILPDPMDLLTLTHNRGGLSLNQLWVRIKEIQEDASGNLTFTCEEFAQGSGTNSALTAPSSLGTQQNYNVSAPDVTDVQFIEVPPDALGQVHPDTSVWLAVCGPGTASNWGGAVVYVSTDGTNYKAIGQVNGSSRMGVLAAAFPVGVDPDIADVLPVDLTESQGALLSGTTADADRNVTACWVNGEVVAYSTAALTSQYKYNLTSYIRRGQYATTIAAHVQGEAFIPLTNNALLKYAYNPSQVGQTIYVKCTSFNQFGGGVQQLANVTARTYTIKGPGIPGTIKNFQAVQVGNNVRMSWADLDDFGTLKGYDIGYAPAGTSTADGAQSLYTLITEASRATEVTTASIPPGTWQLAIWGHNIADQFGPMSVVTLTVQNANDVLYTQEAAPDWLGSKTNFLVHHSGALVPASSVLASALTMQQLFQNFVPFPAANPTYKGVTLDTTVNDSNLRVWMTSQQMTEAGALTPADVDFILDEWAAGNDPNVFIPWSIGGTSGRYFRGGLVENTTGVVVPNLVSASEGPDWLGTSSGFTKHYSGVLVPNSTKLASALSISDLFTKFCPSPVSSPSYTSSEVDAGSVETAQAAISFTDFDPTGAPGNATTQVDAWSSGADPGVYVSLTQSTITGRYFKYRYTQDTTVPRALSSLAFTLSNLPVAGTVQAVPISSFKMTVDAEVTTQRADGVVIAGGGTVVNFAALGLGPYHTAPSVGVTPTSAGVTGGGAINTTTTQTEIHLYTGTSDNGGTCTLQVTGA